MGLEAYLSIQGKEGWTFSSKGGISVFQTSIPPLLILILSISSFPPQDSTKYGHINIPIIHTGMKKHQIKSGYYYIFWGLATISVVFGQVYVGSGYRQMVESIEKVIEKVDQAAN